MRTTRCADEALIRSLHDVFFPTDEEPSRWDAAWIVRGDNPRAGLPVAFATAQLVDDRTVFLQRAGVRRACSGLGLQRRLIRVRERWALSQGRDWVITYVTLKNHASLVNLLRCGYRLYHPEYAWVGQDVLYLRRQLV